MQAGLSPARQARAQYRHELRTLTYVTLDQANGGVVRNLTRDGIRVQSVASVRPCQYLRLRFELRQPRLRVEARGEVVWSTSSGQCGIRFLDLTPRTQREIGEWIFGNLLEGALFQSAQATSIFSESGRPVFSSAGAQSANTAEIDDGLLISPAPTKVIELPARTEIAEPASNTPASTNEIAARAVELDWLSQPLSGRSLAWTVNALVMAASWLLCTLVFLSVTGEPPKWPVSMGLGAAVCVIGFYWGFFKMFGGASLGTRLARLVGAEIEEDGEDGPRFR